MINSTNDQFSNLRDHLHGDDSNKWSLVFLEYSSMSPEIQSLARDYIFSHMKGDPGMVEFLMNMFLEVNSSKVNSSDFMDQATSTEGFFKANIEVVAQKIKVEQGYPITVDYSQSLVEMILAGNYDRFHDEINAENFPLSGEGVQNFTCHLVHLDRDASTEEVEAHLDANGYRTATIEELLAFGAKYPDLQLEFPIVALSSVWVYPADNRDALYLYRHNGGSRHLYLDWNDNNWSDRCRFLAVRK